MRKRQHPLPDGDSREHAVDQMGCCIRHLLLAAPYRACIRSAHAPAAAGVAKAPPLRITGIRNHAIQAADIAVQKVL